MRRGWNRHEAEGLASFLIELRLQFPFAPSVIVLRGRQAERNIGLRFCETLVAPLARKKSRKERVIRLPDYQELRIACTFFFDKNHAAALLLQPKFSIADCEIQMTPSDFRRASSAAGRPSHSL